MGNFDEVLAMDAVALIDPEMMPGVESMVVTPGAGSPRTIYVHVFRDPPAIEGATHRPKMRIELRNDSTYGISSSELNTGTYTITIAYRIGGSTAIYPVKRSSEPNGEDSAWIKLELE